jgi:tetratricopeptide (TPR) repeat protein
MQGKTRLTLIACLAFICGALATTNAVAQDAEEDAAQRKSEKQKTKQAQAVSKDVYDKITKAQEAVDAKDYQGALKMLNQLYNPDKLTEYEQTNVLNYIGFVYYNMDDIPNAIRTYDRMIAVPSLEETMKKQVT